MIIVFWKWSFVINKTTEFKFVIPYSSSNLSWAQHLTQWLLNGSNVWFSGYAWVPACIWCMCVWTCVHVQKCVTACAYVCVDPLSEWFYHKYKCDVCHFHNWSVTLIIFMLPEESAHKDNKNAMVQWSQFLPLSPEDPLSPVPCPNVPAETIAETPEMRCLPPLHVCSSDPLLTLK